jgi:spore coat protein A, manganese oxidase
VTTRRDFIKWGVAGGAGMAAGGVLLGGRARAAPSPAPVDPETASVASSLTPYQDRMPLLVDNAIDAARGGKAWLGTTLISRKVHRDLPPTTLFGYLHPFGPGPGDIAASYLGPVIVARSGRPVRVAYHNGLPPGAFRRVFRNHGASYLQFASFPEVRNQTHLHGGFVAARDDGNPFAQPAAFRFGETQRVTYPNEQPATLMWYHDHYLGATRMNVAAGLAGGYLLRDGFDNGRNPLLPGPLGVYELLMVVQDRMFSSDGSLLYPVAPASANGPWIPEYFGDVMLVNGKVWPKLTVEPAVYRFRVLNACNARILDLSIATPDGRASVPMVIIGTEGGLLPVSPAPAKSLVMAPAERFDVICDFRRLAGQTVLMTNTNPPPPVHTGAPPLPQVMQITVRREASRGAPMRVPGPGSLPRNNTVSELTRLGPPRLSGGRVAARMITLNEIAPDMPAWRLNLNARPYGDRDPVTETVRWNSVEDWYYVNLTIGTHPMHTHLVTFKVMGSYDFDVNGFAARYAGPDGVRQLPVSVLRPYLRSGLIPPGPEESGLKETVKANPGQVTVIRIKFTPPSTVLDPWGRPTAQKYVHHCHIAEHEDNDMMERLLVRP